MGELFSIRDLQNRYHLQRTAMYKLRTSDGFPSSVTPSFTHPRYRESDILAWETKNQ
jgi:hypothetical protein